MAPKVMKAAPKPKAKAMAPKVMKAAPKPKAKAKAKAKAEPFYVFMKNELAELVRVTVLNNPSVQEFMTEAMIASADMDEYEVWEDLPQLTMATIEGRKLRKNSRLMSVVENGTLVEIIRH